MGNRGLDVIAEASGAGPHTLVKDAEKYILDAASVGVVAGTLIQWLPAIAAVGLSSALIGEL